MRTCRSRATFPNRGFEGVIVALIFRFGQEEKIKQGGLQLAGNEYPAGPTGTDIIGTVA